jgi:hypothetical protein
MRALGKPVSLLRILLVVFFSVCAIACVSNVRMPLSQIDTPEHHTSTGIKLLNQGKFTDAGREFEIALQLEPGHSKARAGGGLVKAYRGDFDGGFEFLKQAEASARSNEEIIFALAGTIRVNTLSHASCLRIGSDCAAGGNWVQYSKDAFDKAVRIDPKAAVAYYFMGECYLAALDLDAAGRMFSLVLDFNSDYVNEADDRWKFVQKLRKASPRTMTGKKIAMLERLTRAQAAALLVEEIEIDNLSSLRMLKPFKQKLNDQDKAQAAVPGTKTATDIAGHPLTKSIETVVRIGIKGLDLYPDGTFRPDVHVDRASLALMIEDILIKVEGDGALATRFIGTPSPFPDLRTDLGYFNAVMLVTSRGIMEARETATGAFEPHSLLSGLDALIAIRKVREELRYR